MAKTSERGITPQGENFSAWYNELVLRGRARRSRPSARHDGHPPVRLPDLGAALRRARPPHQGDRARQRLLPTLHPGEPPSPRGRARRGVLARTRDRDPRRRRGSRGAARRASDLGDGRRRDVRPLDRLLSRPAAEDQPVGERRALGAAAAALPAHDGVPLAGGTYGPRHRGGRGRRDDGRRRLLPGGRRGVRGDARARRGQDALGTIRRGGPDGLARGDDARRPRPAGRDLSLPGDELRRGLRHRLHRGRRRAHVLPHGVVGDEHPDDRRGDHDPRGRPGPRAPPEDRPPPGRRRADRQGGRARSRRRGERRPRPGADRQGRAGPRRRAHPRLGGVQVQRLGAAGRAGSDRTRPAISPPVPSSSSTG